jgi:hypothetical protein
VPGTRSCGRKDGRRTGRRSFVRHLHKADEPADDIRPAGHDRPRRAAGKSILARAAKRPGVNILAIHLYVAFAVAALAVLAVWRVPERRITLYVVTLQIVIGIVLMVRGTPVPWYHPALAVLGWIGYMAANAITRRDPGSRRALIVSGAASLLILIAYYAGMQAVKAGYAG